MSDDPHRTIRYPLNWPAWLADAVAAAASNRAMTVATWMREAALEKLSRANEDKQVRHLDHDPRNKAPANLEIREAPKGER
jgi:hypothetical protein